MLKHWSQHKQQEQVGSVGPTRKQTKVIEYLRTIEVYFGFSEPLSKF